MQYMLQRKTIAIGKDKKNLIYLNIYRKTQKALCGPMKVCAFLFCVQVYFLISTANLSKMRFSEMLTRLFFVFFDIDEKVYALLVMVLQQASNPKMDRTQQSGM